MSRYQRVPVKDLIVDERYQRPLDEKRVAKIATKFNERLFGALDVNRRNGKAAVFDGQHRLAAAKERGIDKVPCLVHTDLTPQEEAELFVELQSQRKPVHPIDRFKARVFFEDPVAVEINQTVESYGFRIGANHDGHDIAAVVELEKLHTRGVLNATLGLAAIWQGDEGATQRVLLAGLGLLVQQYGDRLDDEKIERLAAESPTVILRRTQGELAGMGAGSLPIACAKVLRSVAGVRGRPTKAPKKVEAVA